MQTGTGEIVLESSTRVHVLCMGASLLNNVCVVQKYPQEDLGFRCLDQRWERGGNASNNCTVLRQLGVNCEFLGTVAKNNMSRFLTEDMTKHGINIDHIVYMEGCDCPCSTCIVNIESGTRTILHSNKNLPELTFPQFTNAVDLSSGVYSWIHFECRYEIAETQKMLKFIDQYNQTVTEQNLKVTSSVEIEKKRIGLGELISCADYVFLSKDYAMLCGYHTKEQAVENLSSRLRGGSTIICAWGEDGAAAKTNSPSSEVVSVAAYPPERVVDTLGAGDTFVASTIFALSRGDSLKKAIRVGCRVAGAKVGMSGFDGLKDVPLN